MRILLTWFLSAFALHAVALGESPARPRRATTVPKGFATTNGPNFEVDGKPFAFVGANSYWLPLLTTNADVETTFKAMQNAGVKVLRTWGFNAINGSELSGALKSGLTYYQVWNSSDWTLNDGSQGLQRLDNVIDKAGKYGIKVILALTNNWVGYGGAELYINWIAGAGKTHDVFYSDKRIITSFQRYVKTIVNRYKNSPNVFAWELVNEARCLGDLPAGPGCVPGTNLLHNWYQQQSDFIRNLDPNHLITTGGEGQFFWSQPKGFWSNGAFVPDYNYDGEAGEDFDRDLALDNIDFGTYHMYPESWYPSLNHPGTNFSVESWGLDWIDEHASSAKRVGKPLILEEFGVGGLSNKSVIYPSWVNEALATNHAIMPWQFGVTGLTESNGNRLIKYADAIINGASPNDGLAIFPNETAVYDVFKRAAQIQNSRSG